MGSITASVLHNNAESERHFREAINLDPRNATALSLSATTYLSPLGRAKEAIDNAEKAMRVARDGPAYHQSNLGWAYFYGGQLESAIAAWNESLKLFPGSFSPTYGLSCALGELGEWEQCEDLLAKLAATYREQAEIVALQAYYQAKKGDREMAESYAQAVLNPLKRGYRPALCKALARLALSLGRPGGVNSKEYEQAFRLLEEAFQEGDIRLRWLAVNPVFGEFKKHLRYARLAHSLGLA